MIALRFSFSNTQFFNQMSSVSLSKGRAIFAFTLYSLNINSVIRKMLTYLTNTFHFRGWQNFRLILYTGNRFIKQTTTFSKDPI